MSTDRSNDSLRYQRLLRGWSLQRTADELFELSFKLHSKGCGANGDMVGEWERGVKKPSPFYQELFCLLYDTTADQLGFVEALKTSRRSLLQVLGVAGAGVIAAPQIKLPSLPLGQRSYITDVSGKVIQHLTEVTQHYRALQRGGITIEAGLKDHIATVQNALEATADDSKRRELWRILAQSQLLGRLGITKERELGRARTWNESAIASAQYGDDAILMAAAIGHLAHLYLTWQHDPASASQLLAQARDYAQDHPALQGWFGIVDAAVAAKEGKTQECDDFISHATEVAHAVADRPGFADAFFTDFSVVGVSAFAGNCLLKSGEPAKALGRLSSMNLEDLAENRHASALYDMSCAYAALGELEATQAYALRSIDKALATDRLYIVPRFVTLASRVQKKDRHEPHAAAIAEYAHEALR